MVQIRRYFARLCAVLSVFSLLGPALGQDAGYPSRPVTLVVPAPAGGATDIAARAVAEKLSSAFGKPVIVDNRPGANGIIAAKYALSAAPDGYTVFMGYTAFSQNIALRTEKPYALADFTALAQIYASGTFFAVSSSLGVNSLAEFIELVRRKPATYSYASFGFGSTAHIFGEALNKAAGIDVLHVPYKGEAPALTDLLSDQIAATWGSLAVLQPQADVGKIKILAVTGTKRAPAAPNVPTFLELGYADLGLNGWNGFLARAGTPPGIVKVLSDEIAKAAKSDDLRSRIESFGFVPADSQGAEFQAFLENDIKKWSELAKRLNITVTE